MPFKEETSNDKFSTNDCNFEHRQDDLLKEIDRLKSELQSLVPLLDDEPERTLIRRSITHSKEIMSLLGEDNRDEEECDDKLQLLLDNAKKLNQKIVFSDKSNQLWEIVMLCLSTK